MCRYLLVTGKLWERPSPKHMENSDRNFPERDWGAAFMCPITATPNSSDEEGHNFFLLVFGSYQAAHTSYRWWAQVAVHGNDT